MSCIYKIKEGRKNFTITEEKIADYIVEHKTEVVNDSAQVLADKIQTSAAAIIRFSKKLGYKGFTSMKVELARDNGETLADFAQIISEDDNIETLVNKAKNLNMNTIQQVYSLLNINTLGEIINHLKASNRIYLFGVGASGTVCNDLLHKLLRIDKLAFHHSDSHIQLTSSAHIQKDDVAIAVSYSGETREILTGMRYAKKVGATTIGITQFQKNSLSKICDYVLYIPTEEKELRIGAISSRSASLVLTDLLYLGIVKDNLEENKKMLIETRKIVKDFK